MSLTGKLAGQIPDSVRSPAGIVIGHVTDTTGRSLSEVDITVTRESDSLVVAVGATNSQGVARLLGVPSGGPYTVLARKIGYQPARTSGIHVRARDTLNVPLVLHPHVVVLPEVAAEARASRVVARSGFLGIRLFKCFVVGVGLDGDVNEREIERVQVEAGCTMNADAHAARRAAKEAAGEFRRVMRRIDKAVNAGRRPDPMEALLVLNTARSCDKEIPRRPPWPRPDPNVRCRELLKQISRQSLARIGAELATIDSTESFEGEVRRIQEEERRWREEERRRRSEYWERRLDSLWSSTP